MRTIAAMNPTVTPIKTRPDSANEPRPPLRNSLAGHALYLDIDGTILDLAPSPEAVEAPVWMVPLLQEAIGRIRGVQLENKRSVIALHYRNVPERGREVLKVAELVAGGLGSQFGVLMGKCVVEIRPRHLTKGSAMRRLMERAPFRDRIPIFAGDDTTDEDAFEVVNGLGGISLRVGEAVPTAARFQLATPDQLRGWLLEVADA